MGRKFRNHIIDDSTIIINLNGELEATGSLLADEHLRQLWGEGVAPNYGSEAVLTSEGGLNIRVGTHKVIISRLYIIKDTVTNLTLNKGSEIQVGTTTPPDVSDWESAVLNATTPAQLSCGSYFPRKIKDVVVYDTTGAILYVETTDYTINYTTGTITRVPTGSIGDGQTVKVQYKYGLPRFDIVQESKTGVISIKEGTYSSSPVEPNPDADNIKLYAITIEELISSVDGSEFIDRRYFLDFIQKTIRQIKLKDRIIDSALSKLDCVYRNETSNRWEKASFTNLPRGVLTDINATNAFIGEIFLIGEKQDVTGLTPGNVYYMDSNGDLTTTVTHVKIGFMSSVGFLIDIDINIDRNLTGLFKNAIINSDGAISQRGASGSATFTAATTPANNDDKYLIDRWNLLSDGNDIVDVSQSTDAPEGSQFSMKFLVATINKKFGMVQIIENKNSIPFMNKKISLSFQAKTTTGKEINNIRCAILSWDSTADTVTSDVVNAWSAQGTNPTLVANWTYENTASNLALTTSWQKFIIENISIDTANMTNLALFIWCDDTDAALNDELFISQIQVNEGSIVLPFQPRHFEEELALCQRYYEKSYDLGTAPGSVTTAGLVTLREAGGGVNSMGKSIEFKVRKLKIPTCIYYDDQGNLNKVYRNAPNQPGFHANWGEQSFFVGASAAGSASLFWAHYEADAEL